jgi:predicted small lipoprotein YifL
MRYLKMTVLISVVLLIVSGCGQRGSLYLPKEAPSTTPVPATDTATTPSTLPSSEGR